MKIRNLNADEVEIRVQSIKESKTGKIGAVLLIYKDARVDMNILDETFGSDGWQRTHEIIGDNLYCTIQVRSENGEWIKKQDVGVESNTEKEKGQASDSFKRAGFNVGIGRELYTSPFIYVELNDGEYYQQSGKYHLNSWIKFYVKSITTSDKKVITDLVIVDGKGKQRYSMCSPTVPVVENKEKTKPQEKPIEKTTSKSPTEIRAIAIWKYWTKEKGMSNINYKAKITALVEKGIISDGFSKNWTDTDLDTLELDIENDKFSGGEGNDKLPF